MHGCFDSNTHTHVFETKPINRMVWGFSLLLIYRWFDNLIEANTMRSRVRLQCIRVEIPQKNDWNNIDCSIYVLFPFWEKKMIIFFLKKAASGVKIWIELLKWVTKSILREVFNLKCANRVVYSFVSLVSVSSHSEFQFLFNCIHYGIRHGLLLRIELVSIN